MKTFKQITFNKIGKKILKPQRNLKSNLTYKDMVALDMLDPNKCGPIIVANRASQGTKNEVFQQGFLQ